MKKFKLLIIGIIVPVLVAGIGYFSVQKIFYFDIEIFVKNGGKPVENASVIISGNEKTKNITDKNGRVKIKYLRKGKYTVEVHKIGFNRVIEDFDYHIDNKTINLIMPFEFNSWYPWGNINITQQDKNIICISGKILFNYGGYVCENINTDIAGKTLTIKISKSFNSTFNQQKMIKVTYNKNDSTLKPKIVNLINGQYIPVGYDSIDFVIPDNFDGKLGFVFSDCELKNLNLIAFIK